MYNINMKIERSSQGTYTIEPQPKWSKYGFALLAILGVGGMITTGGGASLASLGIGVAGYSYLSCATQPSSTPILPASDAIPLAVEVIPPENYKDIENLAAEWVDIAQSLPRSSQAIASKAMIKNILGNLQSVKEKDPEKLGWDKVLVSKDAQGTIVAIALVNWKTNKLEYLATHPGNIGAPGEKRAGTRGGGTQIMVALAKNAIESQVPVSLESVHDAAPFYEKKLHFKRVKEDNLLIPMELTVEKINELVSNGVPPFNQLQK